MNRHEVLRGDPLLQEALADPGLAKWPDSERFRDRKPKVLVLEDDYLQNLDLQMMVVELGCEICGAAQTSPAGRILVTQHRPDLILADFDLGSGGSGLDVVRFAKKSQSPAVVFVTGHSDRVYDLGVPVLSKPIDSTQLMLAIAAVLN